MSKEYTPKNLHNIHPKRRASIASYVIGTQFMHDLGPHVKGVDFGAKPDVHARNLIQHIGDEEYGLARQSVRNVTPDTNQHTAFYQMGLTTAICYDRFGNKSAHPIPDFLVATLWEEDITYREKLNSDLSINELIEQRLASARDYYLDIALRTLHAHGTTTDLRGLVSRTRHDAHFWLET